MTGRSAATVLDDAVAQLTGAGIPGAARDARLLLCAVLRCEAGALAAALDRDLSAPEQARFTDHVAARCRRQPVAQILGRRDFWRHRFRVTRDVLDPRPETETIVELALEGPAAERLLDLGTGTGCLAVSLLAEWPAATALATDISPAALAVARANAEDAGVSDRMELRQADWFGTVRGRFDLVVCNPPYISAEEFSGLEDEVRKWEPEIALTPGGDGLQAYRTLSAGLPEHLAIDGRALLEIGHRQAAAVCEVLRQAGFSEIRLHKDLGGKDRVVEIRQTGAKCG